MKLFVLIDLWLALLSGVPQEREATEVTPPPTEQAASDTKDDDDSGRRPWYGYLWVGPSINNGY